MAIKKRFKTGSGADTFTIFQPDSGTAPTADSSNDTITFTSTDSTITITGSAATDTLNFQLNPANVTSASPGFTWGRAGDVVIDTWLLNDGVPSNKSGRTMALTGPEVVRVFVASENADTYGLEIFEHEGDEVSLTSLGTVSIVAVRSETFTVSFSGTEERQLAIKLISGTARNLIVGLQLQGTVP